MPILSAVSNSGLTAYSNKLKKILSTFSNSGYSGKDPLWHATTAWVTAAASNDNKLFFDALLVGAGGGGGSGSTHGGGGGGGYLYASGIEIGAANYIDIEVAMARPTTAGATGPQGSDSFIDAGNLWAYGGGGGAGNSPNYGDQYKGPGTVGYYARSPGKGSMGAGMAPGDFTPWQGYNAGDSRFAMPDYIGGGGGGAGGVGQPVNPSSPPLSTQAGAGGAGTTVSFEGFGSYTISGGGGGAHSGETGAGRAPGNGGGGAGGHYVRTPSPGAGTVGVGPAWNAQLGANASTWGAGGGASTSSIWGGRGGNGMVFIKYPNYHANATVITYSDEGSNRDGCVAEYVDSGGFRCWKFTPLTGAVTSAGKNYSYAKARLYFPHRLNHVTDQSGGLNSRPHRLNVRTAEQGGGATAFPIPSAFGPFSVNGWTISLNEETQTSGAGNVGTETDPFCWLNYLNNLTDFTDIGTGDFMLQAYVKKGYGSNGNGIWGGNRGSVQPFFFLKWASGAYIQFANFYDSGNAIGYSSSGTSGTRIVNPTEASVNTWYKVRIQRSGGTILVFVDDVRVATGSDTADYSGTPTLCYIGTNDSYQGVYSSGDIQAFIGQISGLYFKKGTTPVFDLRNSNNYRNVLNALTVIPQISGRTDMPKPSPEILIGGSLDTYSTTNFPSSDKIHSIYWNGTATVNTSITWDGYYPNGVPNTQPTYVFTANTGDFCVDGWFYPTANTDDMVIYTHESDNYFSIRADVATRRLKFDTTTAAGSTIYGPSGGVIANSWNHFAVQRESGTVRVFTNGYSGTSLTGSGAATYNFSDATRRPTIAGRYDGNNKFTGFLSQLRYSRFARYGGSSYTVPTTRVLTDSSSLYVNGYAGSSSGPPVWDATQKNQFVSAGNPGTVTTSPVNESVNVGTVRFSSTSQFYNQYNGNGSLYSDGNGHYFYFTGPKNQRNFKFGTKDFCVEGWWNADYVPAQKTLMDFRSSTAQVAFALKIDTSNRILFVVTNTTRITSAPITLGQSFHLAIERVGGVTTLYINGLRSGVTYSDTNDYIAVQDRPVIFTDGTSLTNESFVGNMQIMRVTKDYPRYSANFSPGPTAIFDTIGTNQTYFPYV